jgi:hypothetical protein
MTLGISNLNRISLDIMTFSITTLNNECTQQYNALRLKTLRIMTFGITKLSMTSLSIMPLSIRTLDIMHSA